MRNTICQAIREKRILTYSYDGYPRVVEPHCYGITTAGNEALRCFQVSGGSASGKVPGWHLMTINKIEGLSVTSTSFSEPRPGYNRGDRGMSTIFEQL